MYLGIGLKDNVFNKPHKNASQTVISGFILVGGGYLVILGTYLSGNSNLRNMMFSWLECAVGPYLKQYTVV